MTKEVIMRVLNGLLGVVLGIVGAVLGVALGIVAAVVWLVGMVLCVTIILLPLGIPVTKLGRRLFTLAGDLMNMP
jgi:ABC-type lipoprotein release transport system permease subunit